MGRMSGNAPPGAPGPLAHEHCGRSSRGKTIASIDPLNGPNFLLTLNKTGIIDWMPNTLATRRSRTYRSATRHAEPRSDIINTLTFLRKNDVSEPESNPASPYVLGGVMAKPVCGATKACSSQAADRL